MSVTGYAGMVNLQGLSLELLPPEEVYAGSAATFNIRISNSKRRLPSFLLEISHAGSSVVFPYLEKSGSVNMPISMVFAERGMASIDNVSVRSPFPVNFFVRSWRLPVSCSFLVFPKIVPGSLPFSGGDGKKQEQGTLERRGSGGEVDRILEYTGREPLKQIHWKLSARSEDFKVKEYGEPAAEPLLIELKKLPGELEARISYAAWIAKRWGLERPVGMILDKEIIPPVQGRRQIRILLARLALYGKE